MEKQQLEKLRFKLQFMALMLQCGRQQEASDSYAAALEILEGLLSDGGLPHEVA